MASYQGTAGNDTINGTGGADTIRGNGGNDTLYGGGGNDVIDGGAGVDTARFRGSFLDYTITWDSAARQYRIVDRLGRDGIDRVSGVEYFRFADGVRSIANLVEGTGDGLVLTGTAGDDQLTGGLGYDSLDGGAGNDLLEGRQADDTLAGGSGTDTARFSGNFLDYRITWDANARKYTVVDQVAGRDGTDTVNGVEYFAFADGQRAISDIGLGQGDGEQLTGTAGDDLLAGNVGYDTLDGGAGNDMLEGGGGNDTIVGGEGWDTVRFSGSSWEYSITWDAATRQYTVADSSYPQRDGTDTVSGVEMFQFQDGTRDWSNLVPGQGDGIVAVGTEADDALYGSMGYDTLQGGDGQDVLFGFTADDLLDGGNGNDMLEGGGGNDRIVGGEGWDTVRFSGWSWEYSITWDVETRQYTVTDNTPGSYPYYASRDGTDTVSGVEMFQFQDGVRDWSNLVPGQGDGIVAVGTEADDALYGSMGYDTLQGGDGQDVLFGFTADDLLHGGNGNDMLEGGGGNDRIVGGEGWDTVRFSGWSWEYSITWDAATRQYTVTDNAPGSYPYYASRDGTDTVSGVEMFQFQDGTRDWSNLVPGQGDGIVAVGTEADDALYGSMGYDTLQGGDGQDVLFGFTADDLLHGGNGNDMLEGGGGNDRIVGGEGWDTVRFSGWSWEYSITWDAATRQYTVTDNAPGSYPYYASRDGTDTVSGVEMFQFQDGTRDWSNLVPGQGDGIVAVGTEADDALYGSMGYDTLQGGDGQDVLFGFTADDLLDGGNGNDMLEGGGGNDRIVGGEGWDTVRFSGWSWEYSITWDAETRQYTVTDNTPGSYPYYASRDGTDTVSGVEMFQFQDGMRDWSNLVPGMGEGVTAVGTDGYDTLYGSMGYDLLQGLGGEDTLLGFGADDVLEGGAGSDLLEGGAGNDRIDGGADNDIVRFSGSIWDYDISWDAANRQYTVADRMWNRDGVDVVRDVENFAFADQQRHWGNLVPGEGDGVTRIGTAADDYLTGSLGYDVLRGGDGNDLLAGYMADDVLDGGEGNDWLEGGHGNDRISGGSGSDTARFSGNSWEYDISWDAQARQYTVADRMWDRDGTDTLQTVDFFQFADGTRDWGNLVPGTGDGLVIVGTAGQDWLYGSMGYDGLYGGMGADHLHGLGANDFLDGGGDDDVLSGGSGNDVLDGGAGDWDFAEFSGNSWEYDISWDALGRYYTIADRMWDRDGVDTMARVEYVRFQDGYRDWSNLVAGAGEGVVLAGTEWDDSLYGSTGYDQIHGGAGNDWLYARESDDAVYGDAGDDWIDGHAGNDFIDGGEGTDTASFAGYSYEFTVSWDAATNQYTFADQQFGRNGTDTLTGVEFVSFYDGTRDIASLVGGSWPGQTYYGSYGNDYLIGSPGADTFYGMDGWDTMRGMEGDDLFFGEGGDDFATGSGGNDMIDGGSGYDTAGYSGHSSEYDVSFDALTGRYTVADRVAGRDGIDTLSGVESLSFYDGLRNIGDLVPGGGGQQVIGTEYGDYLAGTFGADTILGMDGNDLLYGMDGNDLLEGGAGDDLLQGGGGSDTLGGGDGMDVATFSGASWEYDIGWDGASGQYVIADRTPQRDGVDLLLEVEYVSFTDGLYGVAQLVPVTTVGMPQPAEAFIA